MATICTREEYKAHIWDVDSKTATKREAAINFGASGYGCVDGLAAHKSEVLFPGGAVRLFLEMGEQNFLVYLSALYENYPGALLEAHLYCGYLYTLINLETTAQQQTVLRKFQNAVQRWNFVNSNCIPFSVEIVDRGTAEPWMNKDPFANLAWTALGFIGSY